MHQPSMFDLLAHDQQRDDHRQLQDRLPAVLNAPRGHPELWRIDYAPKGYRVFQRELQIFTELHPTVDAAIAQAIIIGFLTETPPLADLEYLFASFDGVLPATYRNTLRYLETTYPDRVW